MPVVVQLHPPEWRLDAAELEAALARPRVRLLVVNTPQNPTGKVFSLEELQLLADFCLRHDVYALLDEVYGESQPCSDGCLAARPLSGPGFPTRNHVFTLVGSPAGTPPACIWLLHTGSRAAAYAENCAYLPPLSAEHLVFPGSQHISLRTLPGMEDRSLRIGSAGKTFSFTGGAGRSTLLVLVRCSALPRGCDRPREVLCAGQRADPGTTSHARAPCPAQPGRWAG